MRFQQGLHLPYPAEIEILKYFYHSFSTGKQLLQAGESLELDMVASRILEEHGRLFTHLALETDGGFDDEFDCIKRARSLEVIDRDGQVKWPKIFHHRQRTSMPRS